MQSDTWWFEGYNAEGGEAVGWGIEVGFLVERRPHDAERLPGVFALGGLVDAHAHLAIDFTPRQRPPGDPTVVADSLRAHLAAGVLLVRDVGAPVGVRVGGDHDAGPVVLAAGRFLAPVNGYLPWLYEAVPDEALEDVALGELAANGGGWVKLIFDFPEHFTGPQSFPEATANYSTAVVRSLCDRVHLAGGRVAAHVSGDGDAVQAVEVGVDSLEHGHDVPPESLRALGARGGAWTPTLTTVWRDGLARFPTARAQEAHYREALAAAGEHGVAVLAGTDASGAGTIADEIALLAELGLTPAQALASAASRAREFLGYPGLILGAPADLVTYHDDPGLDVGILRRPAAVVRKGRRIL